MNTIHADIQDHRQRISQHPFLVRVTRSVSLAEIQPALPAFSFWIMSFQDVLRVSEERATGAEVRQFIRNHRAEAVGQDKWFVCDLLKLEGQLPDLLALFGARHTMSRNASYALLAEAYNARSDLNRLLLIQSAQVLNALLLSEMTTFMGRARVKPELRYFSDANAVRGTNNEAERIAFEYLSGLNLSPLSHAATRTLVERVGNAFKEMLDGFEALISVQERRQGQDALLREVA